MMEDTTDSTRTVDGFLFDGADPDGSGRRWVHTGPEGWTFTYRVAGVGGMALVVTDAAGRACDTRSFPADSPAARTFLQRWGEHW